MYCVYDKTVPSMQNLTNQEIKNYYRALFILANRLVKTSGKTRKECFADAKEFLQENPTAVILTANDTRGNLSTRVVFTDWNKHNEVKGTGRPLKPGQMLFVDLAKRLAGKHDTVSFYQGNIIAQTRIAA